MFPLLLNQNVFFCLKPSGTGMLSIPPQPKQNCHRCGSVRSLFSGLFCTWWWRWIKELVKNLEQFYPNSVEGDYVKE